jgi:hypothetical protein
MNAIGNPFESHAHPAKRNICRSTGRVISMIRVLLVDDHAVVRTGFRLLLQSRVEFAVIGEADSGATACQLYFS